MEILGHIFEQSITDLEELRKEFPGIEDYDNEGRRNKVRFICKIQTLAIYLAFIGLLNNIRNSY